MRLPLFYFMVILCGLCSARDLYSLSPNPANRLLAPLFKCASRYGSDSYTVELHSHHSLGRHFQYIGQELSRTEDFIDLSPYYQATVENEALITIIRSDPGVRSAGQNCRYLGPNTYGAPGLAPLTYCDLSSTKDTRARIYLVYFEPHHTLDLHFEQIGIDFRSTPRFVFINWDPNHEAYLEGDPMFPRESVPVPAYGVYLDTDDLVKLVRSDLGVHEVEVNCEIGFVPDCSCREEGLDENDCPIYLTNDYRHSQWAGQCIHAYKVDESEDAELEVYD